jgi:hypothetical protein
MATSLRGSLDLRGPAHLEGTVGERHLQLDQRPRLVGDSPRHEERPGKARRKLALELVHAGAAELQAYDWQ